jgi:hypothetical protein
MQVSKHVLAIIVVASICLWFLYTFYSSQYSMGNNPIIRPRLEIIEPFQDNNTVQDAVEKLTNLEPDDAKLENPRDPYLLLLNDALKPLPPNTKGLSAERCYGADFQTRLEKTGNFRQLTNNYKRGTPDSCSTPDHDLMSFYKPDPVS